MNNKKSSGAVIGSILGTVIIGCIAALAATACIVPTIKLILWLVSFI